MSSPIPEPTAESTIKISDLGSVDATIDSATTNAKDWFELKSRVAQQDRMISAMIKIFAWLNGSVIIFVFAAWIAQLRDGGKHEIITAHVVMSLIGATVIQAGLAFMAITKSLFPAGGRTR